MNDGQQILWTTAEANAQVAIACHPAVPDLFGVERALEAIGRHGAAAPQALFALASLWLERNQRLPYDRYVTATVSDLLRHMGRAEKRRGGYAREDLIEYGYIVYLLNNLSLPRVEVTRFGARHRRETQIVRIERLINVEYLEMQETLFPGGRNSVLTFKYHLGREMHAWLCGPNPQYREVSGRLLQYHPQRDRFHVLIGFALAFYDRANAQRGADDHRISLPSLLRLIGEAIPPVNPSRYLAQVRRAIEGLRADGVVPGARLCAEGTPARTARQEAQQMYVEFPRLPGAADLLTPLRLED